jgi:hypothetical protein
MPNVGSLFSKSYVPHTHTLGKEPGRAAMGEHHVEGSGSTRALGGLAHHVLLDQVQGRVAVHVRVMQLARGLEHKLQEVGNGRHAMCYNLLPKPTYELKKKPRRILLHHTSR